MARNVNEKVEAILIFGEANRNYHEAVRYSTIAFLNAKFQDSI